MPTDRLTASSTIFDWLSFDQGGPSKAVEAGR
jgi:hypothetical protein